MSGLTYDDSLSETSSVADEERVRRLFQACDYNGDGFIDSSDLEMVCQELELGQSVQELLAELGADLSGRVSYQDFLNRRRALCCEIDALKRADAANSGGGSSQDIPATASNSAGSFNKQEMWEWDSGARDLSPEPAAIKKIVTPAPDAMAELASTSTIVAGPTVAQADTGPASLGPSLYYYGDLERNRTLRDEVPLTHKARTRTKSSKDESRTQKRDGVVLGDEFDPRLEEEAADTRKEKKKKRHKYGRRRTNTYDGEGNPPAEVVLRRHGNSDGDTDDLDDDLIDSFISDFKKKNANTNGESLPLLGSVNVNSCPVTLADRSKAYLCKNLDLEGDELSITYDVPNATRRSVTYSNAGTFPMPDAKRAGHYDEPETEAVLLEDGGYVTRSRSWYLCCPGSGAPGGGAGPGASVRDAPVLDEMRPQTLGTITSAPSPGENQYLHLAAVSSLKNEVLELSARLHAAQRDRDAARDALCAAQTECGRLRSALTSQARSSEERLTELHGVIAELRRACVAKDRAAIPELREDEEDVDTSCRENSVTGNSDRTTSVGDADETASVHNDVEETSAATSPAALPLPEFPSQHTPLVSAPPAPDSARQNLAPADSTSFDEDDTAEIDRRMRSRRRPSPRSLRRAPDQGLALRDSATGDEEDNMARFQGRHSPCVRGGIVAPSSSPQPRVASRVRLRRTHEDTRLTGKDICQEGVYSSAVAEHLARGALGCEDSEERLLARLDRLEADNTLLTVTLRESKEYADRLSLACAQCSAEAGALRMALAAADRAVEAYDVLLALAETSQEGSVSNVKLRLATERVARQLLARLDAEEGGGADCAGPWADPTAMLLYQGANDGKAWSNEEEERLRGHVSRLKRERSVAASGAQPAQWPLQDEDGVIEDNLSGIARSSERLKCLDPGDARKLDMETAVLMQEVMSLREERAELRARLRALRPPGSRQTNSSSGAEEGESERRLLEALARENTLKARLQRLMASVHQAGRVAENNEEARRATCPRCGPLNNRNLTSEDVDSAPMISLKDPSLYYPDEQMLQDQHNLVQE